MIYAIAYVLGVLYEILLFIALVVNQFFPLHFLNFKTLCVFGIIIAIFLTYFAIRNHGTGLGVEP